MIEINLLPEELKSKVKAKSPEQITVKSNRSFNQDQIFIYAIPALLGLFILMHLYLGMLAVFKNSQLASLNRKWSALVPQKKAWDEFNQEYSVLSQDAGLMQLLRSQKIFWAPKLNELSLDLPSGIWFNSILISKNMTINGSVVSLQKDEVTLINKLLENLKADNEFSKDFTGFELSNIQKTSVGGYDVTDFVLIGALKLK